MVLSIFIIITYQPIRLFVRVVNKKSIYIVWVILFIAVMVSPAWAESQPTVILHLDNAYRIWFYDQYPTMNVDLWLYTDVDIKGVSLGFIIRNPLIDIDTVYTPDFFVGTPINKAQFADDTVLVYGDTVSYFHIGLVQIFANSIIPKNKYMKLATCRMSFRKDLLEYYPEYGAIWMDSTKIGRAGDFLLTTGNGDAVGPSLLQIDTTYIYNRDFVFKRPVGGVGANAMHAHYRFLLFLPSNIRMF